MMIARPNKNVIFIFILSFIIFFPNLIFIILGENPAISVGVKKIMHFLFCFALFFFPFGFLRPKVYFGVLFLLLPFLYLDTSLILLTKNHSTSAFYASVWNTNMSESYELVKYNLVLLSIGILSLFVYVFSWYKLDKNFRITRKNRLRISLLSLLVITAIFIRIFSNTLTGREDTFFKSTMYTFKARLEFTYPIGSIIKTVNFLTGERLLSEFKEKNKYFSYKPKLFSNESQTIVLVLGETARKHNFQLYGYSRETNPKLSRLENLIAFSETTTHTTYTLTSFPLILSSVGPNKYKNLFSELGIVFAFKETGFKTYWVTNQSYNPGTIYEMFSMQADSFIDVSLTTKAYSYDEKLTPILRNILKDDYKKRFIVLHTMGSHYRYNFRHPNTFSKFLPELSGTMTMSAKTIRKVSKEMYVNSYDNSILYTDHILSSLIEELKTSTRNSILLYVSDHGENLYDDEKGLVLHGGLNPTKYELEIPMLLWYSDDYNKNTIKKIRSNANKKISSSVVFHTLSSLGGFKTKLHQNKFDLLSDSIKVSNRLFYRDENNIINIDN